MDVELITAICSACVLAISQVVTAVKQFKLSKKNKNLQKKLSLAQVVQNVKHMINSAEDAVGPGNGPLKKTLVMQSCQLECSEKGIDFNYPQFSSECDLIMSTPQSKEFREKSNGGDVVGKENEVVTKS